MTRASRTRALWRTRSWKCGSPSTPEWQYERSFCSPGSSIRWGWWYARFNRRSLVRCPSGGRVDTLPVTLSAVYAKLNGTGGRRERRVRAVRRRAPRSVVEEPGGQLLHLPCCPAIVSGSLMATTSLLRHHRLAGGNQGRPLPGCGLGHPGSSPYAGDRYDSLAKTVMLLFCPTSFRLSRWGLSGSRTATSALCSFFPEIRERKAFADFGIMPTFPSLRKGLLRLKGRCSTGEALGARAFPSRKGAPDQDSLHRPPRQADAGRRHGDWDLDQRQDAGCECAKIADPTRSAGLWKGCSSMLTPDLEYEIRGTPRRRRRLAFSVALVS
jgi:hypothetical protein